MLESRPITRLMACMRCPSIASCSGVSRVSRVPRVPRVPRGLLHGVAAALPQSAVDWMTHPVFRQHPFTFTAVGSLGLLAILPHSPLDVDAENDAQNEEHESHHRANYDCHHSSCKDGRYLLVTYKPFVFLYEITISHGTIICDIMLGHNAMATLHCLWHYNCYINERCIC